VLLTTFSKALANALRMRLRTIGNEFKSRRADALGIPVDIGTAARPMFGGESGKPFLQEASIESSVMGDDEHDLTEKMV
jgi:hypothetical protein